MEESGSLKPSKKCKIETDYTLCIICRKASSKPIIKSPSTETLSKVINYSKERTDAGDSSTTEFTKRIENVTPNQILAEGAFYHRHCYADFGNVEKKNRALALYKQAREQKLPTIAKRTPGRPSSATPKNNTTEDRERTLRSKAIIYSQDFCIICQKLGDDTCRTVAFLQTGQSMLSVANKLEDKSFFLRLNTIPKADDTVANNVKYHLKCWAACKQTASKINLLQVDDEYENYAQTVSDIEIVNIMELELNDPSHKIFDMNSINVTYQNLLLQNGMPEDDKA